MTGISWLQKDVAIQYQLQPLLASLFFVLTGTDYTYVNGQKVIDSAGLYVPSTADQIIGNTQPDFIGGVSNSFTFRNFTLSGLIDFQQGG